MSMQERMGSPATWWTPDRLDDATEEYVWLWNNMVRVQPSMTGVQGSFLVGPSPPWWRTHPP